MSLLAVGVSHQTAPVALLEQFAMAADDRVKALHELVGSDHVSEALVLATCNRIEVFAEVERFHGGVTDVSRVLARQAGRDGRGALPYVTVHYEDQAVAHLFTVAAGPGLDGRRRDPGARPAARGLRPGPRGGHRRRACTRSPSGRCGSASGCTPRPGSTGPGASLVSVALDRAEERIGSLAGRRVLVVGAGSMGALAATTLARRGADVVVSSRTEAHAERLADSVGGRAAELDRLPAELAAADVLVTCTGATGLVVDTDVVAAAMAGRDGRPLVVVDLALPRDVDPGVAGAARRARGRPRPPAGRAAPRRRAPTAGPVAADDIAAAHALIEAETALLRAERQAAEVAPTVSALRSQAAEVVDAELLRLSTRLPDLDARARAEIARTVRRVVDKLLHEPTVRVKELAADRGGPTTPVPCGRSSAWASTPRSTPRGTLAEAVTVDPELGPGEAS